MGPSRIRLGTGTLPSPQLERLATSHPFIQRIDVVFPARTTPDRAFTSLNTTYSTAPLTLSELYEYASRIPFPNVPAFKALPVQCDPDDTWCVDPRGVLTLSVSKHLYEKLGLVGKKLPFKGCPERYVIHVPLKRETVSVAVQARQKGALGIWDGVRAAAGLGKWRVAYVAGDGLSASVDDPGAYTTKDVTACVRRQTDVHVPCVGDLTRPTEGGTAEDDQERLEALFEWIGMACLGAQRLFANDRVDPYVAVYEVPSPTLVDDVTHLCWTGLMDSTFIRSVIDTAISVLSTSESGRDDNPFIAIVLHSNLMTPVSYIPESPEKEAPPRVPGPEGEDTVCLILSKTTSTLTWAIAQSIGKWDARWG